MGTTEAIVGTSMDASQWAGSSRASIAGSADDLRQIEVSERQRESCRRRPASCANLSLPNVATGARQWSCPSRRRRLLAGSPKESAPLERHAFGHFVASHRKGLPCVERHPSCRAPAIAVRQLLRLVEGPSRFGELGLAQDHPTATVKSRDDIRTAYPDVGVVTLIGDDTKLVAEHPGSNDYFLLTKNGSSSERVCSPFVHWTGKAVNKAQRTRAACRCAGRLRRTRS